MDEEVKTTDLRDSSEQFWDLVSDLKIGEELNKKGLSEKEERVIEQRLADADAGETIPHEEVMKEVNQWKNEMKVEQVKEIVPDLPEETRAEIADFVLETLNRPNPHEQ